MDAITTRIKAYLLEEFIDEEDVGPITADTPLLNSGMIDSVSSLQLVEFIERTYGFSFEAHEVDQDNLNTINLISAFIERKLEAK